MPGKSIIIAVIFLLSMLSVSNPGIKNDLPANEVVYTDVLSLCDSYPHSTESFSQGLFFYEGELYESTGLYGSSALYKNIDIKSGAAEKEYKFDSSVFAEGSVAVKDKVYVLSYKESTVFVFDAKTLGLLNQYPYTRQGWGLTFDGEYLVASDGSSSLYFMDEELRDVRSVTVTLNGEEVSKINELEYIDGYVWANVWFTEDILIIDPASGKVVSVIDFSELYNGKPVDANDVFNGIAYNPENGRIYVTGKRWNTLFEFELKD